MLITSQVIASGSGSVGGLTLSRNRGGMYFRARAVPTNPNSPQQQQVRNAMSFLAAYWRNTLTELQRAAWTTYGANTAMVNKLGAQVFLTGQQQFIRSNVPRLQNAGLTVNSLVVNAPTTFNLGNLTPCTVGSIDASDGDFEVNFTNTDDWATTIGSGLLVYASRPQDPSINFFRGPYRLAGEVAGDTTPPTSPAVIALPFAVTAGQRVFFRLHATRLDGRLSADQFLFAVAGA